MTSALAVDSPADVSAALAEAVRRAGRIAPGAAPDLSAAAVRARPALPVDPAFAPLLPGGLRRGTSVGVAGGVASTSLTLSLVGAAVAAGSWCALVGLPPLTAEAVEGFGLELSRVAVVPAASLTRGSATAGWTTAVGALVDAVDLVVVRPPGRLPDGDVRRLTARARSRGAVLVVLTPGGIGWPGLDVRLSADHVAWAGHDAPAGAGSRGHGRLRARRVDLRSHGRGAPSPPLPLWLPGPSGGVEPVAPPVAVPTPLRKVG
ncbi:hypothetical protein ACXR2U_01905 [Jatrophihabitans sp. YIM 134969]